MQRDFAARANWVDAETFEEGEHAPALYLREGLDHRAAPGESLTLHPQAASPDGGEITVSARIYPEASAPWAKEAMLRQEGDAFTVTIPAAAQPGDQLHLIFAARAGGRYRLVHYQQAVVTVG